GLARFADQRGGALEAVGRVFGQLEVVVAADVEVQVGRGQQGQLRRGAFLRGGRRGRRIAVVIIVAATGGEGDGGAECQQDVQTANAEFAGIDGRGEWH